jgi:6,7-dimethyl-8-ribityllumazine synthase
MPGAATPYAGRQGSSSFLKKRTKKLLSVGVHGDVPVAAGTSATAFEEQACQRADTSGYKC